MVDIIYGNEEYKLKEHIRDVIAKYEDPDVIKIDLEKEPVEVLLTDALMPSMFGNTKILIGEGSYFLTGTKRAGVLTQNIDALLENLKNIPDNVHLIFTVSEESLDSRKKVVKELKKLAKVVEYNKKNQNPVSFVADALKANKFEFHNDLTKQIVNQVGHDLLVLNTELEKLIIYMGDEKKLDGSIIKKVLVKNIMDTIWDLMDVILINDKKRTLELYNSLLELGEDPVKIYNIIASSYRLMLEARTLNDAGFTNKDIASNLGVHPYRVELALNKSRRYDKEILINQIERLYDLDLKVKSGKVEPVLGLNNYLLS